MKLNNLANPRQNVQTLQLERPPFVEIVVCMVLTLSIGDFLLGVGGSYLLFAITWTAFNIHMAYRNRYTEDVRSGISERLAKPFNFVPVIGVCLLSLNALTLDNMIFRILVLFLTVIGFLISIVIELIP